MLDSVDLYINNLIFVSGVSQMKCSKCGAEINKYNHFFVPSKEKNGGKRYCIKCAREDKIVTLV